jgi:hypothetical protein
MLTVMNVVVVVGVDDAASSRPFSRGDAMTTTTSLTTTKE